MEWEKLPYWFKIGLYTLIGYMILVIVYIVLSFGRIKESLAWKQNFPSLLIFLILAGIFVFLVGAFFAAIFKYPAFVGSISGFLLSLYLGYLLLITLLSSSSHSALTGIAAIYIGTFLSPIVLLFNIVGTFSLKHETSPSRRKIEIIFLTMAWIILISFALFYGLALVSH